MDRKALEAAKLALRRTEEALASLAAQPIISFLTPKVDTADVWSDLLIHGNRVYTKLEQGSKSGSTKGWFDRHKHARRNDAVLSYMLHARNADEHGLQLGHKSDLANLAVTIPVGLPQGTPMIEFIHDDNGEIVDAKPGPHAKITSKRNYEFTLCGVTDRGIYYPVPANNDGQPFEDHIVMAIAGLFVSKLRVVVEEAEALTPS